ncbi:MAG: hypothetical protein JNL38_11730 [Myxococcales bacterium]|nr:hypothetical protein [Myxococcales bacterium]
MTRSSPWLLSGAVLLLPVACSSSDPSPPAADAGSEAAPASDGGPVSRATFTDLHADFFGPTGRATCGRSGCHSKKGDDGEIASGGFVCAPDKDACYTTMVGATLKITEIPSGKGATDTILYRALRHEEGGKLVGNMPFNKSYVFTADDMRRVEAWLAAGAKND